MGFSHIKNFVFRAELPYLKMLVLLDANFMLLPFQFSIDIYTLLPSIIHEPILIGTIKPVIDEIQKKMDMEPLGSTFRKHAKAGLDLFHTKSKVVIEYPRNSGDSVDDTILKYSLEEKSKGNSLAVATNDKKLRNSLLKHNIHVVFMKSKKTLEYI